MADLFVSYSRRDADYVRRLGAALRERDTVPWIDTEGLADAEVFPAALREAIEAADGFLFVISPAAVASKFCAQEVEHALQNGKRVIPLALEPVPDADVPPQIRERNWIPASSDAERRAAPERIVAALERDGDHVKAHTRRLLAAREWDAAGRDPSLLLRGGALSAAEAWLTAAPGRDPEPTALQAEHVAASRRSAARRLRFALGGSLALTALALGLLVFALISRSSAREQQRSAQTQRALAQSRALAATAQVQREIDPQRSILLASEALDLADTPEARLAAQQALDANNQVAQLRAYGRQRCFVTGVVLLDGNRSAKGLCDGTLVVEDLDEGTEIERRRLPGPVHSLRPSADGRRLVATTDAGVVLLDADSLATTRTIAAVKDAYDAGFDAAGRRLVLTRGGSIGVFDLRSGRLRTLERGGAYVVAMFAGDDVIVGEDGAGARGDEQAGLVAFDARTGRKRPLFVRDPNGKEPAVFADIALVPGTDRVLAGGAVGGEFTTLRSLTIDIDVPTGRIERRYVGAPQAVVNALAVSSDGRRAVIGTANGRSEVRDLTDGSLVSTLLSSARVFGAAFRGGDEIVTTGVDGATRRWRPATDELRRFSIPGGFGGFAGGEVYDAGSQRVRTYDYRTGRRTDRSLAGAGTAEGFFENGYERMYTADNEDGRQVAQLRRTSDGAVLAEDRSSVDDYVGGDGRDDALVITEAYGRQRVHVIPASGRRRVITGLGSDCDSAALYRATTLDGRTLLIARECGAIDAVDLEAGEVRWRRSLQTGLAFSAAVDPGGELGVIGIDDGTTIVADMHTGRLRKVRGSNLPVSAAAFSGSGQEFVTGDAAGAVRTYDRDTLRLIRTHRVPGNVTAIEADGQGLTAVVDSDDIVHVFETCGDCRDGDALAQALDAAAIRDLTADERTTFLDG